MIGSHCYNTKNTYSVNILEYTKTKDIRHNQQSKHTLYKCSINIFCTKMQVETDVNSQNHFQVADILILDTFYHTLFKYFTIYDFNISLELWVRS